MQAMPNQKEPRIINSIPIANRIRPPRLETHTRVLNVESETPLALLVLCGPNSAPNLTGSSSPIILHLSIMTIASVGHARTQILQPVHGSLRILAFLLTSTFMMGLARGVS